MSLLKLKGYEGYVLIPQANSIMIGVTPLLNVKEVGGDITHKTKIALSRMYRTCSISIVKSTCPMLYNEHYVPCTGCQGP